MYVAQQGTSISELVRQAVREKYASRCQPQQAMQALLNMERP